MNIVHGALTHLGKVRANNEDHFLVSRLTKPKQVRLTSLNNSSPTQCSEDDNYLMVVADGMGGAAAGERASALAVESVESFTINTLNCLVQQADPDEQALISELRHALETADRAVFEEAESNARFYGMGTTLTMAFSVGRDLYIVHAGDSRAYLLREGKLSQVTHDHTLVQLLVSGGVIPAEAAKTHCQRNIVTNVVGGPTLGVHAEIHKLQIQDGDVLLLCSDGLTEPVEDSEIAEILTQDPDPDVAAHHLIAKALAHGAPDNVTAIVARYSLES
jgi:protein phosphatase